MSRINTNVNSLIAQRVLGQQNNQLTKSLERLSTGLAINRGADDPAGLIASEKLRSEQASISSAIGNAQRADQVVNIAEGGLGEIQSQLTNLQSLVGQTASSSGLSPQEKAANQLQVDAILQTIDRLASTTSFEGTKLLNGGYDFSVTGKAAAVADFQINGAKINNGGTVAVQAIVTASAQHGTLFASFGGGVVNLNGGANGLFTFDVGGAQGSRQFSFASGTTLANVAASVNTFKAITGVSAIASGNYLKLKSTDFGSDQFVSLNVDNAAGATGGVFTASTTSENVVSTASNTMFSAVTTAKVDKGQDVGAIINGISASGKGLIASVNSDALALSITLTSGATGAQSLHSIAAFTITDSGATFNLGPKVDLGNQVRLGLPNVAVRNLGSKTAGYLSALGSGQSSNLITGDMTAAQKIVNTAIDQVSSLRGRLGAFQNFVVGSTINALNVALENTSAAESSIRDTNFAAETAKLSRSQILVNAATSVLSVANSAPNSILKLLQ